MAPGSGAYNVEQVAGLAERECEEDGLGAS